jgi:glycosyltransferase involved in cell wall biosynthesis
LIPVRNEGEAIVRTLRSLVHGRSESFPLEVVVVDDASSDGCCDHLDRAFEGSRNARLIVRRLDAWSGIPFARNRAAESASHPIYLICDGAAYFPPSWDLAIWRHLRPDTLLAASIFDLHSDFEGHGCHLLLPSMGVAWRKDNGGGAPHPVPVAACTGTVMERDLFHQLGGYDETMPLYGAAEPELSVRAWLGGYAVANAPDLRIGHRFRQRGMVSAFWQANRPRLIANYLRFATYYLPDPWLALAWDHYSKSDQETVRAFERSSEWASARARRDRLARSLPRSFEWYAGLFRIWEARIERARACAGVAT